MLAALQWLSSLDPRQRCALLRLASGTHMTLLQCDDKPHCVGRTCWRALWYVARLPSVCDMLFARDSLGKQRMLHPAGPRCSAGQAVKRQRCAAWRLPGRKPARLR
jgi:hypothetical protein